MQINKNRNPAILLLMTLLWTLIIALSFFTGLNTEKKNALKQALTEAVSTYNHDLNFRSWISSHGGVYIPVTDKNTPNPYLKNVTEQNITTPSGKELTLMNPAWSIRSLNEFGNNKYKTKSHITSLNLIRPENKPDAWETQVLQSFNTGITEVSEIKEINGESFFRYMKPIVTQAACLKCHEYQGHKEGDIRGGISVSVYYTPYLEQIRLKMIKTGLYLGILYAGVLLLILFSFKMIKERNLKISRTEILLLNSNESLEREIHNSRKINEKLKLEIINHKKAEEELKEAYEIMNRSSSVIILWKNDRAMSIDFVSRNIGDLTGYSVEEYIDDPDLFQSIIHCKDRSRFKQYFSQIPPDSQSISIDPFRLICRDDSAIWVDFRSIYRRDPEGNISHIEGIITDVSDNIRIAKEKEKLQIQLNQKNKMDGLGQLAGGIAHDFNNILHGITSAAELLKMKRENSGSVSKYSDIIIQASERASDLTKRLLAYSSKDKIAFKPLDIHETINECAEILQNTINKKIELIIEKKAQNAMVSGDEASLENVLINLVINASQAIVNTGKICISTGNIFYKEDFYDYSSFEVKSGEYCVIEVRDTGRGIPEEEIEKIFDPFFTTKNPGEGTGLGLTSVYSTVENHNGSLKVESKPGIGTTFTISIPVIKDILEVKTVKNPVVSGKGTILFADDEEIHRFLIPELLESLGYEVIVAVNGMDALEKYKKNSTKIDVVLLDMIMPVMDGREAFTKLLEFDKNCRIVICSGYANNENINEMMETSLKGFISKPFQVAEMSSVLENVITG